MRARVCVSLAVPYWCRGISRGVYECGCGATGVFAEEAAAAMAWCDGGSYMCMSARACVCVAGGSGTGVVVLVVVYASVGAVLPASLRRRFYSGSYICMW